jgi:two-component system sensor histidine kinase PilS (NtrC family)
VSFTSDNNAISINPAQFARWTYVARLSIASSIFLAAVLASFNQQGPPDSNGLYLASLVLLVTFAVTGASIFYSRVAKGSRPPSWYYLQTIFDLLLVTAVVHITRDPVVGTSQFAALYILVIASGSLLLPVGGSLLIAALGNVLYVADSFWSIDSGFTLTIWLQLGVFAIVALGSAYLSGKLREAGAGTEAELAQVRLQASDILYNIRSGIITVDGSGRLVYANPMAEHLLGMELEAFIGKPVLDELRRVSLELADALERSVRERQRTTRGEGIIATVHRRFPVGVTTTYTEGDGLRNDRTATAIFQDISDQKRIESLRLRAERLEGVAELSASLAHEIKNPLASIRSAVEQLSRSPFTGKDEQVLARLVMRESDRLSRLLSEFLDYARVHVSRQEPIDLASLVNDCVRLALSHPARTDGIAIEATVSAGQFIIEGDDDLLHRALFNLLLNAIQASPANGVVRVQVAQPTNDQIGGNAALRSGAVALSVSDEGPGIPNEIRDRLFDPFFTTKPGGNGLGLAVVHRAIDAHRGHVLLDSSMPGTRFTVILPCPPREGQRPPSPESTQSNAYTSV